MLDEARALRLAQRALRCMAEHVVATACMPRTQAHIALAWSAADDQAVPGPPLSLVHTPTHPTIQG